MDKHRFAGFEHAVVIDKLRMMRKLLLTSGQVSILLTLFISTHYLQFLVQLPD